VLEPGCRGRRNSAPIFRERFTGLNALKKDPAEVRSAVVHDRSGREADIGGICHIIPGRSGLIGRYHGTCRAGRVCRRSHREIGRSRSWSWGSGRSGGRPFEPSPVSYLATCHTPPTPSPLASPAFPAQPICRHSSLFAGKRQLSGSCKRSALRRNVVERCSNNHCFAPRAQVCWVPQMDPADVSETGLSRRQVMTREYSRLDDDPSARSLRR